MTTSGQEISAAIDRLAKAVDGHAQAVRHAGDVVAVAVTTLAISANNVAQAVYKMPRRPTGLATMPGQR